MATVIPAEDFDAEAAAETLRSAMKGIGTDEDAIIQVIAGHDNAQRQDIKSQYKTAFGRDLEDDLKDELRSNLEHAVLSCMTVPPLYDARELRRSMKGPGTDEDTLIEILTSRNNDQIEAIKEAYKEEFDRDLEEDLCSETSGHFERLLVSLSNAGRDESEDIDLDQAREDAQAIYDAGEGQFGTDESVFNMILCSRSVRQLKATFLAYRTVSDQDIEDAIRAETSGSVQDGYLAIVQLAKSESRYFAERLYRSVKGAGTDDESLIRVVITRSEVDMEAIKSDYSDAYEESLGDAIKGDCSGDYQNLLLALVKEE